MGVGSTPFVLLLGGRSIMRMLRVVVRMPSVVVPCQGHPTAMMVDDHPFAPGVALRQTQHGSSHRAPHGKQDDQQQQQPGTEEFHDFSLSQHELSAGEGPWSKRCSKGVAVQERQLDPCHYGKVKHYRRSAKIDVGS
jgi:hypothetical protein